MTDDDYGDMDALMGTHSVGEAGQEEKHEQKDQERDDGDELLVAATRKPSNQSLHSHHSISSRGPAPDTSFVPHVIDFRTFCRLTDRITLDRAQDS